MLTQELLYRVDVSEDIFDFTKEANGTPFAPTHKSLQISCVAPKFADADCYATHITASNDAVQKSDRLHQVACVF